MTEWVEVPPDELEAARAAGLKLRFSAGRWERASEPAPERRVEEPAAPKPSIHRTRGAATVEDIRNARAIVYSEGVWRNQYRECDCLARYIDLDTHLRDSARHRRWEAGHMESELEQKSPEAFPANQPTPRFELGVVVICSRCKAKDKKGEDYYPDKNSKPENRYPCIRCNGHGVLRNR